MTEYIGDRVERLLKTLGSDKVASVLQKVGRRPCNCAARRDALNKWHQRVLEEIEKLKHA